MGLELGSAVLVLVLVREEKPPRGVLVQLALVREELRPVRVSLPRHRHHRQKQQQSSQQDNMIIVIRILSRNKIFLDQKVVLKEPD